MGYHSADYDHDWKIGVAELARVASLAGTTYLGEVTGCYRVDSSTIDGFAPDNTRPADQEVTLSKYHSADYNRDGRIDSAELARVTELYNYKYTVVSNSSLVRTGQYHDNNPFSVDGFGLGPVSISAYSFDEDHKPTINANTYLGRYYVLRAKMTGSDGQSTQTAVRLNNNGFVLDTLPPASGVFRTELYWLEYNSSGVSLKLGGNDIVWVTIGEPKTKCCRRSQKDCICGEKEVITNEDKGQCFPFREKRSCNAPSPALFPCNDRTAYVVQVPDESPPFYVVAGLFDSNCGPIQDQDDNQILTIIK